MKTTLKIRGSAGRKVIDGSIRVNGSKNDAVQAVASSFLFQDGLTLENLPAIDDIDKMLELAKLLGAKVEQTDHNVTITAPKKLLQNGELDKKIAKHIRASILFTGPLLARYGEVTFPHPGGCVIGARPIDFFLDGFNRMGATATESGDGYMIKAPPGGLKGAKIFFKNQTVTGTETFMMTATQARGETMLKNCAIEPEVENLGQFLIKAGAKIEGLGTPTLTITGGATLQSADRYFILPDRIEAGSLAILGVLLARSLTITDCRPDHLEALLGVFEEMGVELTTTDSSIMIRESEKPLRGVKVKTHEYPGLATDLQAPLAVLLTQAEGESEIVETIFESRFGYAEALAKMGAKVELLNQSRLKIVGPSALRGETLVSPDLRAGLAYLLAGLTATGETTILNVHFIDRGYERIDKRLAALGLDILREEG